MIKIMSKKRWDKLEQQFVELQLDLNNALDDNTIYKKQVDILVQRNKEQEERINNLIKEIDKLNNKEPKEEKKKVVKRARKVKEVKDEEGSNTQG